MTEADQQKLFEIWLAQYKLLLFKVVRAYAFTAADQDDLFQEICIQVWRSIPNYRQQSSVSTWLYQVSINTALKWNRKEQKHRERQSGAEMSEQLLQEIKEPSDERLHWLYNEISRLEEVDRSLSLLLLDGFSYKEMSDILGISESHVGEKIHRIKKHLSTQSKKHTYHGI